MVIYFFPNLRMLAITHISALTIPAWAKKTKNETTINAILSL